MQGIACTPDDVHYHTNVPITFNVLQNNCNNTPSYKRVYLYSVKDNRASVNLHDIRYVYARSLGNHHMWTRIVEYRR